MKKVLSIIICLVVVITITGCKQKEEVKTNELLSSNKEVKLVINGEIDKNIKLNVVTLDNYIKLSESINKYTAYDISLVKYNGNEKEKVERGNVDISIKIPDGYNKEKLVVYNISNNVITEKIDAEIDGNYIKFNASRLTAYAVAEEK